MEQRVFYCTLCNKEMGEEERRGLRVDIISAFPYRPDNNLQFGTRNLCPSCHERANSLIKPLAEFLGARGWKDNKCVKHDERTWPDCLK